MRYTALFLSCSFLAVNPLFGAEKLEAEEVIARHLERAGGSERLLAHASLQAQGNGTSRMLTGGGGGPWTGPAFFMSKGNKLLFQCQFQDPQYPGEMVAWDEEEVRAADSSVGRFLYQFKKLLEEGLIGGVLSTDWALMRLEERKAKLKSRGSRKENEQEIYELEYQPRRGSDAKIQLLFDAETFQHVGTTYQVRISLPSVSPGQPGSVQRFTFEEWFSDFRKDSGLELPHHWQLKVFEPDRSMILDFQFDVMAHNVEIPDKAFALQQ